MGSCCSLKIPQANPIILKPQLLQDRNEENRTSLFLSCLNLLI